MEVIVLTTLFSIIFAVLFLLLFLRLRQTQDSCAEQDALLPFRDDELMNSEPREDDAAEDSTKATHQ